MWPDIYYREEDEPWNPLRDIMRLPNPLPKGGYEATEQREYFRRMSRALAWLCRDHAAVLTPDFDHMPPSGIWNKVEKPALIGDDPRPIRLNPKPNPQHIGMESVELATHGVLTVRSLALAASLRH
jgi:hypothetical protein